jgi:predicted sulfurtransferase
MTTNLLETYPGYRPRFVAYNHLPDLEMIICDGCGYVVSEDEFLICQSCEREMCLYCESGSCQEHDFRFSVKRDKFGEVIDERFEKRV